MNSKTKSHERTIIPVRRVSQPVANMLGRTLDGLGNPSYGRIITRAVLLAVLAAGFASTAGACDTPVYRYAMYRWSPAYYAIFYLHDAPTPDDVAAVHAMLNAATEDETQPLNIELIDVDMAIKKPDADDTAVVDPSDRLPAIVRDIWTERDKKRLPAYIVLTPQYETFPLETLDVATVKSMIDSPKRQELFGLLNKGQTMAFVLLTGEDDEANKKAEATVNEVIELIASGKGGPPPPGTVPQMPYFAPPTEEDQTPDGEQPDAEPGTEEQPADEEPEEETQRHEIGLLTVDRNDPAEAWLVKCLLGVESDLPTLTEPMVFGVYGRARALPPCVGAGINPDNLMDYAWFVAGKCSCTVKEQNPGVDLLVRCNWDVAVKAMSDRFGAEEGNPYQYGGMDMFPELLIPADDAEEPGVATDDEPGDTPDSAAADDDTQQTPDEPDTAQADDESPSGDPAASDTGSVTAVAIDTPDEGPESPAVTASPGRTIGIALTLVIVLLAAATVMLAKKP